MRATRATKAPSIAEARGCRCSSTRPLPGKWGCNAVLALALVLAFCGCGVGRHSPVPSAPSTPDLDGVARERRQVQFPSEGVMLAGELDLPVGTTSPPLVFVIHHSGPVDRDAYGYLAELLAAERYAVFRFDKRGTGISEGEYGCCEGDDALAAYRAAMGEEGFDRSRVFIVAQSIGTRHLADRFSEYVVVQPLCGVVLLSNLLGPDEIGVISAPILIVLSDSEPDLDRLGRAAAQAHRDMYPFGASYYVAEGSEHTLFDVSAGPIDWDDPQWPQRYHRGAMRSVLDWLEARSTPLAECVEGK
jgi:pimeloyl-ACP methyl ester carboxylesterase